MDPETQKKLDVLDAKINAIYVSVEKTRKYFFWTMILTLAFFVLPLLGLVFVIPMFMSSYIGNFSQLGL